MFKRPTIFFFLMFSTLWTNAQFTAIPDTSFEKHLINIGLDSGTADGFVPTASIDTLVELYLFDWSITDLTGIEDFLSLKKFYCGVTINGTLDLSTNPTLEELYIQSIGLDSININQNPLLKVINLYGSSVSHLDLSQQSQLIILTAVDNQLTNLDLSQNSSLRSLEVGGNPLSSLDLSQNDSITVLNIRNTLIDSIDISSNLKLWSLYIGETPILNMDISQHMELHRFYCGHSAITSLDVSANTNLTHLGCEGLNLGQIDVTANPGLKNLSCGENQLTKLDVSQNPLLESLNCNDNLLTTLDLKVNEYLERLNCQDNQLTLLDLRNDTNIRDVNSRGNSGLQCILVEDRDYNRIDNWWIDVLTSIAEDTSECSYRTFTYSPARDSMFSFAIGEWEWIQTYCGFGEGSNPSTVGFSKRLKLFQTKEDKFNHTLSYELFHGDTLKHSGYAYVDSSGTLVYQNIMLFPERHIFEGNTMYIFEDTLLGFGTQWSEGCYAWLRRTSPKVAVEEYHDFDWSVAIYPNPVSAYLAIKLNENNPGIKSANVYDLHGRLLIQEQFEGMFHSLSVESLPEGLYFLELKYADHLWRQKFVVVNHQ